MNDHTIIKTVFMRREHILPFILLFLILFTGPAKAQDKNAKQLSLDEAISIALDNNPEIQNAGLQVTKSITLKKGAWIFDPLELMYHYGQINAPVNDRYIEINQNFGSLLTHIQQRSMAKKQVEASLAELEISKRSLTAQVESAYFFWWYMHEKLLLGKEETLIYDDMKRIADLRYQLGEFSDLEKMMASARSAEIENNFGVLSDEFMIAENKLKQLMMTEAPIIPPDGSIPMYQIDKPSDTSTFSNAIVTEFYKKSAELSSVAIKSERARFFPELNAGFFYQDMYPLKGLTGWHFGFSFPLLAFNQASKIKAARIEEEIALNQLEQMAFSTDKTIENLIAELTKYFRQLQYYNEYALKQADEIIRNARLQFEKENMEYMEYVQSLSMALSIKVQYLETLNNYNQTAIQLEFYAY